MEYETTLRFYTTDHDDDVKTDWEIRSIHTLISQSMCWQKEEKEKKHEQRNNSISTIKL